MPTETTELERELAQRTESEDVTKQQIRGTVRGAYDIQQQRIDTGGRLMANFRAKLGIEPDEEGPEADEIMEMVEQDYKRLTDGVATITRIRSFDFEGVISNFTELALCDLYFELVELEKQHFNAVKKALRDFDIYTEYLTDVKGIGPAMAGVIVSEIDIRKATYPSSLWAYAGLDVVTTWHRIDEDEDANMKPWFKDDNVPEDVVWSDDGSEFGVYDEDGQWLATYERRKEGRGRKKHHLKEVEYEDADGNTKTKKSLGYNPFLKTKLIGVLATSFLRSRNERYREVYDNYRHRIENMPKHEGKSDGHIHNMALRKMIKEFLKDLYNEWRCIEDLPVAPTYAEKKLGMTHGEVDAPKDD